MTNVLPQQAGLQVNSVFYRYRTVKETEDEMIVYVENKDAVNDGFVFQSVDNWTGMPGNSINKLVSTGGVPIDRWGDGSIRWTGKGEVLDPSVAYTYQYDPCFDPQSDPTCPGYKVEIPDIYQPVVFDNTDEFLQNEIDRKMTLNDEDEEERNRQNAEEKEEEENEEEVDLEQMFGIINESLQPGVDAAKMNLLTTMQSFSTMYYQQLPDTKYDETVVLDGGKLPRNRRNNLMLFSQQKLHNDLIKLQYQK